MDLIYDKPISRPLPCRAGWTLATAILWLLWIAMWAPLVAATAWPLGLDIAGSYLWFPLALTMMGLESIVFVLLGCVTIACSFLLTWSWLHYLRFRHANRRVRRMPAQLEELADYSALLSEKMAAWQKARRVVAHHDEYGRLLEAEVEHAEAEVAPTRIVQRANL